MSRGLRQPIDDLISRRTGEVGGGAGGVVGVGSGSDKTGQKPRDEGGGGETQSANRQEGSVQVVGFA